MINTQNGRNALQIIEVFLEIFAPLQIGKHFWEAKVSEEQTLTKRNTENTIGMYVTSVSIYIQLKKTSTQQSKTRFGKLLQATEPSIVVGPFYNCVNVHYLNMWLMVGKTKIDSPEDSILTLPFRKDLNHLLFLLKEQIPELNSRA